MRRGRSTSTTGGTPPRQDPVVSRDTPRVFRESALPSREHARVGDEVVDRRIGVRPVDRRRMHELGEYGAGRRQGAIAGDNRRSADQDETGRGWGSRAQTAERALRLPTRRPGVRRRGRSRRAPQPRLRADRCPCTRDAQARRLSIGRCRVGRSGSRNGRAPRASGRTRRATTTSSCRGP